MINVLFPNANLQIKALHSESKNWHPLFSQNVKSSLNHQLHFTETELTNATKRIQRFLPTLSTCSNFIWRLALIFTELCLRFNWKLKDDKSLSGSTMNRLFCGKYKRLDVVIKWLSFTPFVCSAFSVLLCWLV